MIPEPTGPYCLFMVPLSFWVVEHFKSTTRDMNTFLNVKSFTRERERERERERDSYSQAEYKWLTPVILATWEAEIRRMVVQGQSGQIVHETPISKITRANELEAWHKR
jgi:hypothetical protein